MLLAGFVVAMVVSIILVPLGLPGTFLMIAAALAADYLAGAGIGWAAIGVAFALAVVAEALEWTLSARYARQYGGSPRAGWGALLGGFAGAIVGVPVPVIGSVIVYNDPRFLRLYEVGGRVPLDGGFAWCIYQRKP